MYAYFMVTLHRLYIFIEYVIGVGAVKQNSQTLHYSNRLCIFIEYMSLTYVQINKVHVAIAAMLVVNQCRYSGTVFIIILQLNSRKPTLATESRSNG